MRRISPTCRFLLAIVVALGLATVARADEPWRDPLEPLGEAVVPGGPAPLASDPCSCARELRSCLITATINLGRCLGQAFNPARQTLCYIKFELDVVLCLDRAATCDQTCVP